MSMTATMATTATQLPMPAGNPAGWPEEVLPIFERAITCQFATVTRRGTPLTYPAKAERARRNPRVALLFADPVGAGLADPPVVLVQGLATVRDADLQANADRYARLSLAKLPGAYRGTPRFLLRRQAWYFARIWVEVTPLRILWWPGGRTDEAPRRWEAPAGTRAAESDPAPPGRAPAPWKEAPADWRPRATEVVDRLGAPVLTVMDEAGFPVPLPTRGATLDAAGFRLELPSGSPCPAHGPACLTFHTHAEEFVGQENAVFVGQVAAEAGGTLFRVERGLGDFSLAGNALQRTRAFLGSGRRLAPRTEAEAARRGQPVPEVRLPR